jgi:hypothetical protein
MPKLSAVVVNEATVSVDIGGDAVTVTYRPRRLTPEFQEVIAKAEGHDGIRTALYGPVSELLVSWDLFQDDGSLIDCNDTEQLRQLPSQLLLAIMRGILGDARPNLTRRSDSSNGSVPTAGSEPRQIGTPS